VPRHAVLYQAGSHLCSVQFLCIRLQLVAFSTETRLLIRGSLIHLLEQLH
jgi:hypothetical protein